MRATLSTSHGNAGTLNKTMLAVDVQELLGLPLLVGLNGRGDDATITRASIAIVVDHEGLTRTVLAGESRHTGARRVENLAAGVVTETITVVNGNDYQVTIYGEGTAVCSGAFTGTLTADGSSRISWASGTPKTASSTSLTITVTGTLYELLVEDVTGQADQNPSEHVSPSKDYGAGVDGVRYFDYENGNTVAASGVVTEAKGSALSTMDGVLVENAAKNFQRRNTEMDNATSWTWFSSTPTQVGQEWRYIRAGMSADQALVQAAIAMNDGVPLDTEVCASLRVHNDTVSAQSVYIRILYAGGNTFSGTSETIDPGETRDIYFAATEDTGTATGASWRLQSFSAGDYNLLLSRSQFEQTLYPTSLIINNDIDQNTREATDMSVAWPVGLDDNWMVKADFVMSAAALSGDAYIAGIGVDSSNEIGFYVTSSGARAQCFMRSGNGNGDAAYFDNGSAFTVGQTYNFRAWLAGGEVKVGIDGVKGGTDGTEWTEPSVDVYDEPLQIGARSVQTNQMVAELSNVSVVRINADISDVAALAL